MANPQKENGYTAIANEIMVALSKAKLLGSEYQIVLWIIRQTYGFQKKEDVISLSQFQKATSLTRSTVIKSIKNLLHKKIITKNGSRFMFNKDWEKWGSIGVCTSIGVYTRPSIGVYTKSGIGVYTHKRKKERIKEKPTETSSNGLVPIFIDLFKEINPTYKWMFGRPNQRQSAERLLKLKSIEDWQKIIKFIVLRKADRFCPRIATPLQLEQKYPALESYALSLKVKGQELKEKYPIV